MGAEGLVSDAEKSGAVLECFTALCDAIGIGDMTRESPGEWDNFSWRFCWRFREWRSVIFVSELELLTGQPQEIGRILGLRLRRQYEAACKREGINPENTSPAGA